MNPIFGLDRWSSEKQIRHLSEMELRKLSH